MIDSAINTTNEYSSNHPSSPMKLIQVSSRSVVFIWDIERAIVIGIVTAPDFRVSKEILYDVIIHKLNAYNKMQLLQPQQQTMQDKVVAITVAVGATGSELVQRDPGWFRRHHHCLRLQYSYFERIGRTNNNNTASSLLEKHRNKDTNSHNDAASEENYKFVKKI